MNNKIKIYNLINKFNYNNFKILNFSNLILNNLNYLYDFLNNNSNKRVLICFTRDMNEISKITIFSFFKILEYNLTDDVMIIIHNNIYLKGLTNGIIDKNINTFFDCCIKEKTECTICDSNVKGYLCTNCVASICELCILKLKEPTCPFCKADIRSVFQNLNKKNNNLKNQRVVF